MRETLPCIQIIYVCITNLITKIKLYTLSHKVMTFYIKLCQENKHILNIAQTSLQSLISTRAAICRLNKGTFIQLPQASAIDPLQLIIHHSEQFVRYLLPNASVVEVKMLNLQATAFTTSHYINVQYGAYYTKTVQVYTIRYILMGLIHSISILALVQHTLSPKMMFPMSKLPCTIPKGHI